MYHRNEDFDDARKFMNVSMRILGMGVRGMRATRAERRLPTNRFVAIEKCNELAKRLGPDLQTQYQHFLSSAAKMTQRENESKFF